MATYTLSGAIGELRSAGAADGGVALSTTVAYTALLPGTTYLALSAHQLATAKAARYLLNPYIVVVKAVADLSTSTDYSENAQDGSTATDVTLSSLVAGGFLYVGAHLPFGGLQVDVDAANGTAATTLAAKYWKSDNTWTSITPTDGTAAGGVSLAQDGAITWTVPTDWTQASLFTINTPAVPAGFPHAGFKAYWVRLEWDKNLDSSTTLNSILPINRSTAYAELIASQGIELQVHRGPGGIGSVQGKTDAGTASLEVICGTAAGMGFI